MSQSPYDPSGQSPTAPFPTAPPRRPFHKRPAVWAVAAALLVGVGIGNAGGESGQASSPAAASTSTAPSSATVAPTTTPAPVTVTVTQTPPPVTSSAPAPVTAPVVDFTMPDLVGIDLQTAQNTIQGNGVFLSRSHDLLGMRNQVLDSNWVVCTQSIPAGQQVTGDAEGLIDLGVVKREESCP